MKISREQYTEYLQSQEWWDRRNKVMERACGLCEGCRQREPVEVHHLTYEHVTQEFLWELVALCAPCHERIHGGTGQSVEANHRQTRQTWERRKTEGDKMRERVKRAF